MILRILKQHQGNALLFLLASISLLAFLWFGNALPTSVPKTILARHWFFWMSQTPWMNFVGGLFMLFVIIVSLQSLTRRHIIFQERTYLVPFFYTCLLMVSPTQQFFSTSFFLALALIFILHHQYICFRENTENAQTYLVSIFLGFASLLYPPSVYYLLFFYMGLNIIRPLTWKDISMIMLGYVSVVIFVSWYLFLFDQSLMVFWSNYGSQIWHKTTTASLSVFHYYYFISLLVFLLVTSIYMFNNIGIQKIQLQRYYTILILLFFYSILLFFVVPSIAFELLPVLAIPGSFVLTNYFLHSRIKRFNQFLFFIWMLTLLLAARWEWLNPYFEQLLQFVTHWIKIAWQLIFP